MSERDKWSPYASVYDPMRVSNIDSSADYAHDKAIIRACKATYKPNTTFKNRPECTLFIGRLDIDVIDKDLEKLFSKHGKLRSAIVVRDMATGFSKRYGFVEFKHRKDAERAQRAEHRQLLKGREMLVDFEHQHKLQGWIPRRLGGGFGGRKESGQLRFGCIDRPWKRPVCHVRSSSDRRNHHEKRSFENTRRDSDRRSHRDGDRRHGS